MGLSEAYGSQYIVGSYVKWIEAAGARAALLNFNATSAQLAADLQQLNGLVLTGGGSGIHNTLFGNKTFEILDLATAAGVDLPLWGTCQGFQQLAQYASGGMEPSIL